METSICVKCGGAHKVAECKATQLKCANCKENAGCKIYQKQVKEKIENIKKKSNVIIGNRQFSQVIKYIK